MSPTANNKRILIVDDEPPHSSYRVQNLIQEGLRQHGRLLCRGGPRTDPFLDPELAVIDIQLAGISGVDSAIQMTRECPRGKLVLLKGFSDFTHLLKASQQAKYSFEILVKPIQPEALLQLAESLYQTVQES